MKNSIRLFVLLLLYNCSHSSKKEQLLEEYLLLNQNSWNLVNRLDQYSINKYSVGDTLTLNPDPNLTLLQFPDDTSFNARYIRTDEPKKPFHIKQPTKVIITWSFTGSWFRKIYQFKVLNDSTIIARINSDDLIRNLGTPEDLINEKNYKLGILGLKLTQYQDSISELARKYDISEDSLNSLIDQVYSNKFEVFD